MFSWRYKKKSCSYGGTKKRKSAPTPKKSKSKIKERKALSANNKPKNLHNYSLVMPRRGETQARYNRRVARRRNTRIPRQINRHIVERDLGDIPDEPSGVYRM